MEKTRLARSKTAGSIKIYKSDYANDSISTKPLKKQISKDDSNILLCPPLSSSSLNNLNLRRSNSSGALGGWLSQKSIRNVQEKTDYESKEITNMYYSLLENEEKIQKDLEKILVQEQVTKNRKLHWLLQKWYENTYIPLDNKICQEMNSFHWKDFDAEKRKQFINYLKHRNKKGHVFLDIFEEAEYDPMLLNKKRPGPIKAVTEKLADPLLHQQRKRNDEDRVVYACDSSRHRLTDRDIDENRLPKKPLVPLGRHDTECNTWLDMKLYDIQSHVRLRSQERLYGIRNVSRACLHDVSGEKIKSEVFSGRERWRKRRQFPTKRTAPLELI